MFLILKVLGFRSIRKIKFSQSILDEINEEWAFKYLLDVSDTESENENYNIGVTNTGGQINPTPENSATQSNQFGNIFPKKKCKMV